MPELAACFFRTPGVRLAAYYAFNEQLRQDGLQEGERQKALAIAKKMLADRVKPDRVKELTDLSDEDIQKIAPPTVNTLSTL